MLTFKKLESLNFYFIFLKNDVNQLIVSSYLSLTALRHKERKVRKGIKDVQTGKWERLTEFVSQHIFSVLAFLSSSYSNWEVLVMMRDSPLF